MSGFVVVVNTDGAPVDRGLLARLTVAMAFRGPDAQRVRADGPVGLGHALLATVDDYPEAPQPCSLDGQAWLAGDVRVDGRADLVAALAAHADARALADASDPELVLHAYRAWGEGCVEQLIGDFAFAVWDGARRRLFCARDQMGVRPIYYARTARALVVSNTLDAVRLHPAVTDALDDAAVADFLLFGGLSDPLATVYRDVRRLPAAHVLTSERGGIRTARYWSLQVEPPVHYRRARDYTDNFAELLAAAAADRLRAATAGVLMSGGMDSSSVAAVAHRARPAVRLRAYTTVYDSLFPDDERHFAGRVANHVGVPIRYQVADGYLPYERWTTASLYTPEPVHEPLRAIFVDQCATMAGHSRVALTGYGADPALTPSPNEVLEQLRRGRVIPLALATGRYLRRSRALPRLGFRTARRRHGAEPVRVPDWLAPELVARTNLADRQRQFHVAPDASHPFRPAAVGSLSHPFWASLLEGIDANFTRVPLQFRHPFLDVRLLRYALALPSYPWCVDKLVLREAMRGLLPEDVRRRPKQPLHQDPVPLLVERHRGQLTNCLGASPRLARYVRGDWDPSKMDSTAMSADPWTELCPLSLNYWLYQHERDAVARSESSHPDRHAHTPELPYGGTHAQPAHRAEEALHLARAVRVG